MLDWRQKNRIISIDRLSRQKIYTSKNDAVLFLIVWEKGKKKPLGQGWVLRRATEQHRSKRKE
jgi:hypothetical protein